MRPLNRLLSSSALGISLAIYALYRSPNTTCNRLLFNLISNANIRDARLAVQKALPLPSILNGSLPGGLWVFAATLISGNVFIHYKSQRINLQLLPCMIAVFFEIQQLLGLSKGTSDSFDIIAALAGWALARPFLTKPTEPIQITDASTPHRVLCVGSYAILILAHVQR